MQYNKACIKLNTIHNTIEYAHSKDITPPPKITTGCKTVNLGLKRKLIPHSHTFFMSVKTQKTYTKSKFFTQKTEKKEKKKVKL